MKKLDASAQMVEHGWSKHFESHGGNLMMALSLRRRLRFAADFLKFFVAGLRRNHHILAPWTCGEMSLLLLPDTTNVVNLFRREALGSRKLGNGCWVDRASDFRQHGLKRLCAARTFDHLIEKWCTLRFLLRLPLFDSTPSCGSFRQKLR